MRNLNTSSRPAALKIHFFPQKKRPQTFRAFFFGVMLPFGGQTLFQTDFNQPVIIRMIDQNGAGAFLPKLFKQP